MPINTRELLDAVAVLTDEREIRVTLKESGKGAVLCGAACFVGGVLLGPVGLAAGGVAGALAAAGLAKGKFRSVGDIIRNDLTDRQREMLVQHIMTAVAALDITDVAMLLPLLAGGCNPAIHVEVLRGVTNFLTSDMRLRIID